MNDPTQRQQWTGAPGYAPAPPPPPSGRTSFWRALGAAAVWAGVGLVVVLVVLGPPASGRALGAFVGGMVVPVLFAALVTWLIARRKAWAFWQLTLLALPFFGVLRLLLQVAGRSG